MTSRDHVAHPQRVLPGWGWRVRMQATQWAPVHWLGVLGWKFSWRSWGGEAGLSHVCVGT